MTPLNIITNKKDHIFGVTSSNLHQKETHYTSFVDGKNSFMNSSGHQLSSSLIDKEFNITNYEDNLAWGKIGLSLYDPGSY